MSSGSRIVIHQPYFLPWPGYFHKLIGASELVILDNVAYRARHYVNRARIRTWTEPAAWVTLPLSGYSRGDAIRDIRIEEGASERIRETLRRQYSRAAHFPQTWPAFEAAFLASDPTSVLAIDCALLRTACAFLGMERLRFSFASEHSDSLDRDERMVEICHSVGATALVMGVNSLKVHDVARLEAAGIEIWRQQKSTEETEYQQVHGAFVGNVSILDAIFNLGPSGARGIVEHWGSLWSPR